MAYIRKTRTGSGATAVQVCWKKQGKIVRVEHIGSAKTEVGLERLMKKAREFLDADKNPLFDLAEFDKGKSKEEKEMKK